MIERVAMAIHSVEFELNNGVTASQPRTTEMVELRFAQARAAIEAMREPTEPMLQAGVDATFGLTPGVTLAGQWVAMCDQALEEQQPE